MTDKRKSIISMIISSLGFALMGVFIKLTGDIPTVQKVVIRSYIIFITSFIMMRQNGVKIREISHHKLLILRSTFGTLGILFNFYAVDHLILSDASILFRLSTFFLLFFSWIFLKERMNMKQFASVVVAFIGILLIIKPQFTIEIVPYLAALFGAGFAASAYTVVRILGKKEAPLAVVFYFATFTAVILTPVAVISYVPMTFAQLGFAVLSGLSAAMGQVGVTYAYKHAPAKEVSIYNYLGVVFSAIFSIFIFDSVPDMLSIVGYVIVFGTAYYMWKDNS